MFVYTNKMLHECLHAFMLSNYPPHQCPATRSSPPRLPNPPPQQCPAIFCELLAMLPHNQRQRMALDTRTLFGGQPTCHSQPWSLRNVPSISHRQKVIRVQTGLKIKHDFKSGIISDTPWKFKLVWYLLVNIYIFHRTDET